MTSEPEIGPRPGSALANLNHGAIALKTAGRLAGMLALLSLFTVPPVAVEACGWWGDGETSREDRTALPTHDGIPLPETISLEAAKLPNGQGFGIAVQQPGKAVPYLQETYGRRPATIGELKTFGFETVIDLGTPADTAKLHRTETESVGMTYFSIPVTGNTPSVAHTRRFSRIILENADHSLLVYSPSASLLGMMWASHRINMGSPVSFAISEGRLLGLTAAQEDLLQERSGTRRD